MSQSDLIVPIHDRRQRKRYFTLRNFAILMGVVVLAFIVISTWSEVRGTAPGDYGQLWRQQVPSEVEQRPVEIVTETPPAVRDATGADPMLLEPAVRSQWLTEERERATTMAVPPVAAAAVPRGAGDVAIVGGPDGVALVQRERRRPELSGGFGRDQ